MDSREIDGKYRLSECEPKDWYVVFHRRASSRWVEWLACGRFKHVSVFGWVDRAGAWVFYDYQTTKAFIHVVPDAEADAMIAHFCGSETVVRMPRPAGIGLRTRFRPGSWCVPSVAHIIGLPTCALRPDRLFRHCLAHGGEILKQPEGPPDEDAES